VIELMGRTVPTFRNIIDAFNWEWKDFRRALRLQDKEAFDNLLNNARRHAAAGTNMVHANPFEPIIISILLEHQKAIQKITEHDSGKRKEQQLPLL
jgi:hypothetical protein